MARVLARSLGVVAMCWSASASPVWAHPAWGVLVAPDGTILFADVNRNVVWRVGHDGRLQPVVRDRHSHAIRLEPDGSVVGEHVVYDASAQRFRRTLWRLLPDGRVTDLASDDAVGPAAAYLGSELVWLDATDPPERRIRLMAGLPNGSPRVLAGGPPGFADGVGEEARFVGINALTVGSDGNLYVTDGPHVRMITPTGRVATLAAAQMARIARGSNPRLLGVAAGADGAFVADYDHHVVRRLTASGQVDDVLHSGAFWSPVGLAFAGDRLLVLEERPESLLFALSLISGPRLRVVEADGTSFVAATVWQTSGIVAICITGIAMVAVYGISRWRRRGKRASVFPG